MQQNLEIVIESLTGFYDETILLELLKMRVLLPGSDR